MSMYKQKMQWHLIFSYSNLIIFALQMYPIKNKYIFYVKLQKTVKSNDLFSDCMAS